MSTVASKYHRDNLSDELKEYDLDILASLSPRTRKQYLDKLTLFEEWLVKQDLTLKNISWQLVIRYLNHYRDHGSPRSDKKPSGSTVQDMVSSIRSYTSYAWDIETLSDKEYRRILKRLKDYVKRLPVEETKRTALTAKQVKQVEKALAGNPLFDMLFFAGTRYGLRNQEYCQLKVEDINLTSKLLFIEKSKGEKDRYIPILDQHVDKWKDWLEQRKVYAVAHGMVFFSTAGNFIDRSLQNYFQKMSELTGIKFTTHILRYTFATILWSKGVDILVISKLLGHESVETTQKYLKVTQRQLFTKYREQAGKAFVF
ncbi:MAG: tyrosine-type recombinase/integrase [Candidatus Odinarchaeota archaeon]